MMFRLCRVTSNAQRKSIDTISACLYSSKSSNKSLNDKGECLSSEEEQSSNEEREEIVIKEREINLLGPADVRTPLPGNVGPVRDHREEARLSVNNKTVVLKQEWTHQKCPNVVMFSKQLEGALGIQDAKDRERCRKLNLDLVVQKCPHLLGKDFQDLFAYRIFGKNVTLITFFRRSDENLSPIVDITESSSDSGHLESSHRSTPPAKVNHETDKASSAKDFVQFANILRRKLNEAGFWADYIDHHSDWYRSRHQKNPLVHQLVLKLDVQYRKLGFNINESGPCRVVSHKDYNSSPYVGSLLTNASQDSPKLKRILNLLS